MGGGRMATTKLNLEEVDIRLAVTDAPVADLPFKIRCREKQHAAKDHEASLAVYRDHIHCYGCGFKEGCGNRLYALAYLLGVSVSEARKLAPKYTEKQLDAYRERVRESVRRDPLPNALATVYQGMLLPLGVRAERRSWLYARGLVDWMIERAVLGHDTTRFTIPYFAPNRDLRTSSVRPDILQTIRFRRDDFYFCTCGAAARGEREEHEEDCEVTDQAKYMGMYKRNGLYLYPEQFLSRDYRDWVVVCEGEFDALRLWQENIPAVTVPNGAGNLKHLPALLRESYPRLRRFYIATDMDEAGHEAGENLQAVLTNQGFDATKAEWRGAKDITELYLADPKGLRGGESVVWYGPDVGLPNDRAD